MTMAVLFFLMEAGHSRRFGFSIPNQSHIASLLKKRKTGDERKRRAGERKLRPSSYPT